MGSVPNKSAINQSLSERMQTHFQPEQLSDPLVARSEAILRKCVHCGFCTATCPTFALLGDELDSPRGRIYLIKDMLENDRPADARTVKHIDRCLSCLSCMTTCPSGVNYMHLVDHARIHIEKTYERPFMDRLFRNVLAAVLPYPSRFRLALLLAMLGRPFAGLVSSLGGPFKRVGAMLRLAPTSISGVAPETQAGVVAASEGPRKGRVIVMNGCAQPVLAPHINEAAMRLLTRAGVEVVFAKKEGCCGALVHHMGREEQSLAQARRNIDAWMSEIDGDGVDAILITVSGCGTTVKDYGHMLAEDPKYADKARRISDLAKDVSEYVLTLELGAPVRKSDLTIAYHSACSMQHGQKITTQPKKLLRQADYQVRDVPEGHLCCGSAGTYNILQPEIADQLRSRKLANIAKTNPDVIATGNIGCITQLGLASNWPVVHTVELLDWAYGGPRPSKLAGLDDLKPVEPPAALPEPA